MAGHEMDPSRNNGKPQKKAQPGACAGLSENAADIPEKFNAWR